MIDDVSPLMVQAVSHLWPIREVRAKLQEIASGRSPSISATPIVGLNCRVGWAETGQPCAGDDLTGHWCMIIFLLMPTYPFEPPGNPDFSTFDGSEPATYTFAPNTFRFRSRSLLIPRRKWSTTPAASALRHCWFCVRANFPQMR